MRRAWRDRNLLDYYGRHLASGALIPMACLPLPAVVTPCPVALNPRVALCWWRGNHFLDWCGGLAHNGGLLTDCYALFDDGCAVAQRDGKYNAGWAVYSTLWLGRHDFSSNRIHGGFLPQKRVSSSLSNSTVRYLTSAGDSWPAFTRIAPAKALGHKEGVCGRRYPGS